MSIIQAEIPRTNVIHPEKNPKLPKGETQDDFIARGGKVYQCYHGETGITPKTLHGTSHLRGK
jgi:hypothetical protein